MRLASHSKIAIQVLDSGSTSRGFALASRLNLPMFEFTAKSQDGISDAFQLLLEVSSKGISIRENRESATSLRIDFTSGPLDYRRRFGSQAGGQLLVKAIGGGNQKVLDCTAGLGRDSFILAAHGCEVTAVERDEIIFLMLEDALRRGLEDEHVAKFCSKINLVFSDATKVFHNPTNVVYFDPMFTEKKKSSLPKKEMQLLQMLTSLNTFFGHVSETQIEKDTRILMEKAFAMSSRVVVKRASSANPVISNPLPTIQFKSASTRFDVYLSVSNHSKKVIR